MSVREPAVAGQFYPGSRKQCEQEITALLAEAGEPPKFTGLAVGGIVPHAGWVFSGAVAAEVIALLAGQTGVETFVVFGAMHRYASRAAGSVYARGAWETPLGQIAIDEELAQAVLADSRILKDEPDAHEMEHSIEVQLPEWHCRLQVTCTAGFMFPRVSFLVVVAGHASAGNGPVVV